MTAIEAMIYCLGDVSKTPTDGEYQSRVVYDHIGYEHWISWRMSHGKRAKPLLRSGSDINPFAEMLEPYSAHKLQGE